MSKRFKFFLCLGIFLGYLLGAYILNLSCSFQFVNYQTRKKLLKKNVIQVSKPTRKTLYVGVMTAEKFLGNRATACNATWANHSKVNILKLSLNIL